MADEIPIHQPPGPPVLDFSDVQQQAQELLDQLAAFADGRVGGRHMGVARTEMEAVVYHLCKLPPAGPVHELPPGHWPPPQ